MLITIKCKLNPTNNQIKILDKTLVRCLNALNYISKIAWDNLCFNRAVLHHLTYYKVKTKFKLQSQICCSVGNKVVFSYKTNEQKQHIFKNPILPLNFNRTISFNPNDIISICTIKGRQKIHLILGEYQKQILKKATKFCDSELIKRNKKFYLNITIEIPDVPIKEIKDVIGVDIGITNLATCSTGDNFTGKQVQSVRKRYHTLRSSLQSKGTRSARRHLKKMSGKEKRFQKDVNHCVSKKIVDLANQHNLAIALEDLTHIRRTIKKGKKQRRTFNNWAFYQLRNFISYKAQRDGTTVVLVNPAYTSQTCSSCETIGIRNGQDFHCSSCGFQANADFNASLNIKRVAFNQLIVAGVIKVKGSNEQLRPNLATIS